MAVAMPSDPAPRASCGGRVAPQGRGRRHEITTRQAGTGPERALRGRGAALSRRPVLDGAALHPQRPGRRGLDPGHLPQGLRRLGQLPAGHQLPRLALSHPHQHLHQRLPAARPRTPSAGPGLPGPHRGDHLQPVLPERLSEPGAGDLSEAPGGRHRGRPRHVGRQVPGGGCPLGHSGLHLPRDRRHGRLPRGNRDVSPLPGPAEAAGPPRQAGRGGGRPRGAAPPLEACAGAAAGAAGRSAGDGQPRDFLRGGRKL